MQTIKQSILSIAIGLALVAGISYAWEGATKNPPENNAPAPINVGSSPQVKTGPFGVSGGIFTAYDSVHLPLGSNISFDDVDKTKASISYYKDNKYGNKNGTDPDIVSINFPESTNGGVLKVNNGWIDARGIKLTEGATDGFVLTSDNGWGVWKKPPDSEKTSRPKVSITNYKYWGNDS